MTLKTKMENRVKMSQTPLLRTVPVALFINLFKMLYLCSHYYVGYAVFRAGLWHDVTAPFCHSSLTRITLIHTKLACRWVGPNSPLWPHIFASLSLQFSSLLSQDKKTIYVTVQVHHTYDIHDSTLTRYLFIFYFHF